MVGIQHEDIDHTGLTGVGGGSLASDYAEVVTDEQRASGSTAFADLSTAGPAVTITVNTKVRVTLGAACYTNGVGSPIMGIAVSGANTIAANYDDILAIWMTTNDNLAGGSRTIILEGLTPGSTTFTAKYAHYPSGITANFKKRSIFVECLD